jgi:hypothetical protein
MGYPRPVEDLHPYPTPASRRPRLSPLPLAAGAGAVLGAGLTVLAHVLTGVV